MPSGDTNGCGDNCGCATRQNPIARRDFLKAASIAPIALMSASRTVMAGPFESPSAPRQDDKRLDPAWVKSLTDTGKPTIYKGADLEKIGMPVGGIGAGQLYLGGDGKLWHWDIFNIPHGTGDGGYARPPLPESPIEQGFAIQATVNGTNLTRTLDKQGFKNITFMGQYPIGTVTYHDADFPVKVTLEAFSPFIPLNADDSSLPATILRFTVANTAAASAKITLLGWLQNAVGAFSNAASGRRVNEISFHDQGHTILECSAKWDAGPGSPLRAEILFEDWNRETYGPWTTTGNAFGTGPVLRSRIPAYQGNVGGDTDRVVNSHATAPGNNVEEKDRAKGTLTSAPFQIERNYLKFWIGGGSHRGRTCLNLLVDGKVVRSATGSDNNAMHLDSFDIRNFFGKQAQIQIVDNETNAWGNIGVGRIVQSDGPVNSTRLEDLPDFGTLALSLIGVTAEHASAKSEKGGFSSPNVLFSECGIGENLIGSIGHTMELKPGTSKSVDFAIAWNFPNLSIDGLGKVGRYYAAKFKTAKVVAEYIMANHSRLTGDTLKWRDTWYASTLPYYFIDRTLLNICNIATSACYRFANGRFYAWEGVGCCAGTCTHVWHYAQAMARLFPELERDIRERIDFGLAYHPDSGVIGFRAEFDTSLAVDGQTGTLLRAYREHQMSPNSEFLTKNWKAIKGAYDPLFKLDTGNNGVLQGPQMNTLDQPWFGKVSWLSSLYIASLRAGAAMAIEMNDTDFAHKCTQLADSGSKIIDDELFNGEYYVQTADPANRRSVGSYDGCEVDQVFGAGWAGQVGLDGVLPREHVRTALRSLWKYSFLMDVGPYRESHKPGRWYAMAGEAGLLMCSWPKGDANRSSGGFDFYLNECMTGFEHQAAGHMLREGLITEGLSVVRAIHDRYHASRRNPWNEVECGDHYNRAMASFGVYLSALGYEYHGPKKSLAFGPRFGADNFKAAFTASEGWGSYTQTKSGAGALHAAIEVKHGVVQLNTLKLALNSAATGKRVRVTLNGKAVAVSHTVAATPGDAGGARAIHITLPNVAVSAGSKLQIEIA